MNLWSVALQFASSATSGVPTATKLTSEHCVIIMLISEEIRSRWLETDEIQATWGKKEKGATFERK